MARDDDLVATGLDPSPSTWGIPCVPYPLQLHAARRRNSPLEYQFPIREDIFGLVWNSVVQFLLDFEADMTIIPYDRFMSTLPMCNLLLYHVSGHTSDIFSAFFENQQCQS